MIRVHKANQEDFSWLTSRTGLAPNIDARGIKAVDDSGRIIGMVLFCAWTENSVTAHVALDSPVAIRALAEPAFSYPFEEAGRKILLGTVASSNFRSYRLALRLGFKEVHRIRNGHAPGSDLVLLQMTREEWAMRKHNAKWLRRAA